MREEAADYKALISTQGWVRLEKEMGELYKQQCRTAIEAWWKSDESAERFALRISQLQQHAQAIRNLIFIPRRAIAAAEELEE